MLRPRSGGVEGWDKTREKTGWCPFSVTFEKIPHYELVSKNKSTTSESGLLLGS